MRETVNLNRKWAFIMGETNIPTALPSQKKIIKKTRALYKMSKIFVVLRREIKMNTRKFISQAYQNKQAQQNQQAQQQGFQSLSALRCPNRSGKRES